MNIAEIILAIFVKLREIKVFIIFIIFVVYTIFGEFLLNDIDGGSCFG